ncbi:class I SAM-dependent methyltransferase [Candidatus Uhrbacteria bacterium]|nr:class I SAM-dependent methyltransferase [Candidatus Uhrbacteria bacterium]
MSAGKQITVELGSGTGNLKEFKPDIVSSDVDPCDWLDMNFDAHEMPFHAGSVSNIVMIDVLHHLADPIRFFHECERVLEKGGRIILLEPYPSIVSWFVYKFLHPEPYLAKIDYFGRTAVELKTDPWDANVAAPFIIFYEKEQQWHDEFEKSFRIITKREMSFILYPLSGGFEYPSLVPEFAISFFVWMEKMLRPLRKIMAFRCYIVIERK